MTHRMMTPEATEIAPESERAVLVPTRKAVVTSAECREVCKCHSVQDSQTV